MTLGKKIRLLRAGRSLSQSELAQAAGHSRRTVTAYETGTSVPGSMAKYRRLAEALGVEVEVLLDSGKPDTGGNAPASADPAVPESARELCEIARSVFSDENLTEADKDLIMHSLQEIYWDIKKEILEKKDPMLAISSDD